MARTHRCGSLVDDVDEALAFGSHRRHEFEIADREAVEAYVSVFLDTAEGCDVGYVGVLGEVEIVQQASGGDYCLQHVGHSESFEAGGGEMAQEAFLCGLGCIYPVVEFEHGTSVGHGLFVGLACAMHAQHLLGGYSGYELLHIVGLSSGTEKLAGGYVEEGHSGEMLSLAYPSEEIVFPAGEHRVGGVESGSDKLGDASSDKLFGELWVFKLLADGHTASGSDQFREVGVECVVGKSGEFDELSGSVGPAGECDAEYLARRYGIVGECFVEVTHSEEEYGVGMLFLHLGILPHEWSLSYLGHLSVVCGGESEWKYFQHPCGHADVNKEPDHIVGDLDEWPGGQCGVDFQPLEGEGHQSAEDSGEDYHRE